MSKEYSNPNKMAEAEYLAFEEAHQMRHEYIDGEVVAMSGGSKNHYRLIKSLTRYLDNHLINSPCEAFAESIQVKLNSDYFYPDIVVDCSQDDDPNSRTANKPTLIIEILSPSTRNNDKGKKFIRYINIDSVQEYVLIEPNVASIEVFRRSQDWFLQHYGVDDEVTFESVGLTLKVSDIYRSVSLLE